MDTKKYWENFDNVAAFLIPLLEAEFSPTNFTISIVDTETQSFSKLNDANDSIANTLNTMKSRYVTYQVTFKFVHVCLNCLLQDLPQPPKLCRNQN